LKPLHTLPKDNLNAQYTTSKWQLGPLSSASSRSLSCSRDHTPTTPDVAPLATSAHSLHPRSHQWDRIQLPQLRNLAQFPRPALAPLEPQRVYHQLDTPFAV
jgi:hypothetical protein